MIVSERFVGTGDELSPTANECRTGPGKFSVQESTDLIEVAQKRPFFKLPSRAFDLVVSIGML